MKKYKLFLLLGLFVLLTGCSYSFEIETDNKDDDTSSIFLVVPDVSGMDEDDAINILEMNGFSIGEVVLTKDYKYEDDLVIKTEPVEGIGIIVDVKERDSSVYEDEFTIVDQEPKVGSVIESGDTVVLYIAG